ncbi:MAG: hypothetical protein RL417_1916 [Pseudomonadota bacterium]
MRFDRLKTFPYPVLRPGSDDYLDGEFRADVDLQASGSDITASINFALSVDEIREQVRLGNAKFVCLISCRETYVQQVVESLTDSCAYRFEKGKLRGETRVDAYVVAVRGFDGFSCSAINPEFGGGPLSFSAGDVLAQDESYVFYIEREVFRSLVSLIELVKKDSLPVGTWAADFEDDFIKIQLSPADKEAIDLARNKPANRLVLLNSIYFAVVMQGLQRLKDDLGDYEHYKWAKSFQGRLAMKDLKLESEDSCKLAQLLMENPLKHLTNVFAGSEK